MGRMIDGEFVPYYNTVFAVRQALKRLQVTSLHAYDELEQKDPRLPPLEILYGFSAFIDAPDLVGMNTRDDSRRDRLGKYEDFNSVVRVARRLEINSKVEYFLRYKEDPALPYHPWKHHEFKGFRHLLGLTREKYPTWQQAGRAARVVGITRESCYPKLYKADPLLPVEPRYYYKDCPGFRVFVGTEFYSTWREASFASRKLCISSQSEYRRRYKTNPSLPSNPASYYEDFPGWDVFLRGEKKEWYATVEQASSATRELGIISSTDYKVAYRDDARLPANPDAFYRENFPGWPVFLGKVAWPKEIKKTA